MFRSPTTPPTKALLALFAAVCWTGCGGNAPPAPFVAVGVVAPAGGVARNDPLVVRFSAPIGDMAVPEDTVRVMATGGAGATGPAPQLRLPVTFETHGDLLYVRPLSEEGWPANATLTVEVPHPVLGRPMRATTGAAIGAAFAASTQATASYSPRAGFVHVVASDAPDGQSQVTVGTVMRFTFDAAMDPASFDLGISLVDADAATALAIASITAESPRRIAVRPFNAQTFRAGGHFRLAFAPPLRAVGDRLLEAEHRVSFSTTDGMSNEHSTDFRPTDLVDPGLNPTGGPLRAQFDITTISIGTGNGDRATGNANPFAAHRSRVQVLIPADELGGDDALIERIVLQVQHHAGSHALLDGFRIRLDYAAEADQQTLRPTFAQNWRHPSGAYTSLADAVGQAWLLAPADADQVVITLAEPFVYQAGPNGHALVLEFFSPTGAPEEIDSFFLAGTDHVARANGRYLYEAGAPDAVGTTTDFLPALTLVCECARVVVLQPWTTDIPQPTYFPRRDMVTAAGREWEHFRVEFQGSGTDDGRDPTPWLRGTRDLGGLAGCRTVQARIVFLPRPYRPGASPPTIERLTLPFRAGH